MKITKSLSFLHKLKSESLRENVIIIDFILFQYALNSSICSFFKFY